MSGSKGLTLSAWRSRSDNRVACVCLAHRACGIARSGWPSPGRGRATPDKQRRGAVRRVRVGTPRVDRFGPYPNRTRGYRHQRLILEPRRSPSADRTVVGSGLPPTRGPATLWRPPSHSRDVGCSTHDGSVWSRWSPCSRCLTCRTVCSRGPGPSSTTPAGTSAPTAADPGLMAMSARQPATAVARAWPAG